MEHKIINMGDVLAPDKPRVRVEGTQVLIPVKEGLEDYPVPLRECASERHILRWICHLSRKTWCTPDKLGEFVEVAMEANGLGSPWSPNGGRR